MWANSCFLIKQESIAAERGCGEPGILQPSTFLLLLLSPPRDPLLQPRPIHELRTMGTRAQAPSAGSAGRGGSRDNQEAGRRAPPAPLGATKPLGGAGGEILTHLPSSFPQPSQLPPALSYQETARCAQTRASRHRELSRFLDLGQGFSKKQTLTAEPLQSLLAKHQAPSNPHCKPSLLPGVGHL